MIRFPRFTAALALAGAILSTPAHAAIEGDARSVAVPTADLNLAASAGRAALLRRVGHAASLVCGRPDARDLNAVRASAACRAEALQSAMPQVRLALARGDRQFAANAF